MLSFHKNCLALFAVVQLLIFPVIAETTSHVAYSFAGTGSSLTEGINEELERLQEKAYAENKFFEFVSATLTFYQGKSGPVHLSYICVLYNLSDAQVEPNHFITKVAYASAWTPSGIYESIQEEIDALQNLAMSENKAINFLDIKISVNGNAYIIYEISRMPNSL